MEYIFLGTIAYLCGSIPFGKLIGNLYGTDIQKRGSGNIGFANVQRVLGWRAGLLTLCGDIVKGVMPTLLAQHFVGEQATFLIGYIAVLGHLFPAWLRFHGGKGIATGLGVVIVLQPFAAAVGAGLYVLGRVIIKNSALSSIAGIVAILIIGCLGRPSTWWQYAILLATALWTLRYNIARKVPNYDI